MSKMRDRDIERRNTEREAKMGCGCFLLPVGSYNSCGQLKRTLNSLFGEDEEILYCDDCKTKINNLNNTKEEKHGKNK